MYIRATLSGPAANSVNTNTKHRDRLETLFFRRMVVEDMPLPRCDNAHVIFIQNANNVSQPRRPCCLTRKR